MDYEREKGRIAGLASRRRQTAQWAMTLVPFLQLARTELRPKEGREITYSAYAEWLNSAGQRAREGGFFLPPTVSRLFDIHVGLIDDVEQAFDIEVAIATWHSKRGSLEQRESFATAIERAQQERIEGIRAARHLCELLRGTSLPIQDIVPRLVPQLARERRPRGPQGPLAGSRKIDELRSPATPVTAISDEQGQLPLGD